MNKNDKDPSREKVIEEYYQQELWKDSVVNVHGEPVYRKKKSKTSKTGNNKNDSSKNDNNNKPKNPYADELGSTWGLQPKYTGEWDHGTLKLCLENLSDVWYFYRNKYCLDKLYVYIPDMNRLVNVLKADDFFIIKKNQCRFRIRYILLDIC